MRRVIIESPYAGDVDANIAYAKRCVHDCLLRGEAPIASHLFFTQPGILDDNRSEERQLGIDAGHAWYRVAEAAVVYTDRGVSGGMLVGIDVAHKLGVKIEYRTLPVIEEKPKPKPIEAISKFKVGQLWKNGHGATIKITDIANNVHHHRWLTGKIVLFADGTVPPEGGFKTVVTYEPDGAYSPMIKNDKRDLVELVGGTKDV